MDPYAASPRRPRRRGLFSSWAALALGCCLLALPLAARAKAVSPQRCQAAELGMMGRFLRSGFQCWSRYQRSPAADPAGSRLFSCLAKADQKLVRAYTRELAKAGPGVCGLEVPVDAILSDLQVETDTLSLAISESNAALSKAEGRLHATLQKATGKALDKALSAEQRNAAKPDESRRLAKRDQVRSKLVFVFAREVSEAAARGATYTGLDGTSAAGEVDQIVDELVARTAPAGGTAFSVSGVVMAAEGSLVDSDVNDPNTVPVSNDSPAAAQAIPVPATVGGYVNLAGAGAPGNSQQSGDPVDLFLVSLTAGQRVNLRLGADPSVADLDLCLFDVGDPGTPLDCSLGTGDTEEVVAPSSGDFLVEVEAFAGCACASSYVLTLGQTLPARGPDGVRLSDEFRPGEAVVTLANRALYARSKAAPRAAAFEPAFGMRALAGRADREMLFRFDDGSAGRSAAFTALGARETRDAMQARFPGLDDAAREKLDTLLALKALVRRADVDQAEPNYVLHALAVPNDSAYPLQWHYPLINLPAAWDITKGSASVRVAVVDTGVLLAHPDLQGQVTSGFDFISDPANAGDGDGIDGNADDPGDGAGGQPSSFHGTHVAGTIGAKTNNGTGVAGVNWNVTLVPVRVLGVQGGSNYDVLQGVRYAAGLPNDSGTTKKSDVINLSLGGGGFSSVAQGVFTQARSAGVVVVAAAGNSNTSQLFYPASYDGVVSVSAVETRKQKAPYSNFGAAVDVAAPGGDTSVDRNGDGYADGVLSTLKNEGTGAFNYVFYQGTSMASPHMAGVVALMKAVDPALTPVQLDSLLASGAITEDLGAPGRDDVFGNGLIDARKAVLAVSGPPPADEPLPVIAPMGLNFGTTLTQASFSLGNGGGGTLSVSAVTDDAPWLIVTPAAVDADGLGSYQASVDRSGLPAGTYSATISVSTSAGTGQVAVVMSVESTSSEVDAGFHYVVLVDPDTLDTVAEADVAVAGGRYAFSLQGVPAGSYLLYAGSDLDNDFLICDGGEACGAWPTLGSPEVLDVTSDLSGLDFVTGFQQSVGTSAASPGGSPADAGLRRLRLRSLGR